MEPIKRFCGGFCLSMGCFCVVPLENGTGACCYDTACQGNRDSSCCLCRMLQSDLELICGRGGELAVWKNWQGDCEDRKLSLGFNGLLMKTDKGRSMVLRKLKQEDAVGMLEWMQDEQIRRNFRFTTDKKRLTQTEVLEFIDTADYVFRVVFERGIQDVKVVWNIKRRVSAFRGGGIRPFVIDLAVWQMDTASLKERQRNEMGAGTAGEFYKDGF